MDIFQLFISAIFVNNIVLAQYLGNCPYLGCSKEKGVALGMGGAVIFVIIVATACTWLMQRYVLEPFGLGYLQTIVFIVVIASLVQFVEMFLKKMVPPLYAALGIFLPLITTNCAVMGVAILVQREEYDLLTSVLYGLGRGLHPGPPAHGGHPRAAGYLPSAQGHGRDAHRPHHGRPDVAGFHGLQGHGAITRTTGF